MVINLSGILDSGISISTKSEIKILDSANKKNPTAFELISSSNSNETSVFRDYVS